MIGFIPSFLPFPLLPSFSLSHLFIFVEVLVIVRMVATMVVVVFATKVLAACYLSECFIAFLFLGNGLLLSSCSLFYYIFSFLFSTFGILLLYLRDKQRSHGSSLKHSRQSTNLSRFWLSKIGKKVSHEIRNHLEVVTWYTWLGDSNKFDLVKKAT